MPTLVDPLRRSKIGAFLIPNPSLGTCIEDSPFQLPAVTFPTDGDAFTHHPRPCRSTRRGSAHAAGERRTTRRDVAGGRRDSLGFLGFGKERGMGNRIGSGRRRGVLVRWHLICGPVPHHKGRVVSTWRQMGRKNLQTRPGR